MIFPWTRTFPATGTTEDCVHVPSVDGFRILYLELEKDKRPIAAGVSIRTDHYGNVSGGTQYTHITEYFATLFCDNTSDHFHRAELTLSFKDKDGFVKESKTVSCEAAPRQKSKGRELIPTAKPEDITVIAVRLKKKAQISDQWTVVREDNFGRSLTEFFMTQSEIDLFERRKKLAADNEREQKERAARKAQESKARAARRAAFLKQHWFKLITATSIVAAVIAFLVQSVVQMRTEQEIAQKDVAESVAYYLSELSAKSMGDRNETDCARFNKGQNYFVSTFGRKISEVMSSTTPGHNILGTFRTSEEDAPLADGTPVLVDESSRPFKDSRKDVSVFDATSYPVKRVVYDVWALQTAEVVPPCQ